MKRTQAHDTAGSAGEAEDRDYRPASTDTEARGRTESHISELLSVMTLEEKIGQLHVINGSEGRIPPELRAAVRAGRVGAILNEVDPGTVAELQRLAAEESPLGIPLLIGRDVVHGFHTVFPIPLGMAASWNPALVQQCARIAAREASASGVNWTYAPMVDIGRDPRWGRVAETLGEDPYLSGRLAAAMVRGFQGDDLSAPDAIAACAKHFAGYGASESGRDYNTTNIPERELRGVHLPSFKAALDAGVASFMTSFSDLDGVPATANDFLLRTILRGEWGFDGIVVSDWDSIPQLAVHGIAADDRECARLSVNAGIDMEMASSTFEAHLASLIASGHIRQEQVDAMVANVLRIKFRLGLFDRSTHDAAVTVDGSREEHLDTAYRTALQSMVLLKNDEQLLPLRMEDIGSLAVVGPLADDPYEQLGTWIFDGDPSLSRTPLQAITGVAAGRMTIRHARGTETTRSRGTEGFAEAIRAAKESDATVLFLGEEAILTGEAHCRADISLPGVQEELALEIASLGKPTVLVVMAGRPLTLEPVLQRMNAVLYAWHPGSMGGPAIADILFGKESPSGKLPVTFPRSVGQVPMYYAHKNTGRPATQETILHIDDIPARAPQISTGLTSFHLDDGAEPLFPFGYGLSYASFSYSAIRVSSPKIAPGGALTVSADVTNTGSMEAEETVQLYVRDRVGSVTRPVRELKGFRRVRLKPGERVRVTFELQHGDLAFWNRDMQFATEPGAFDAWIGGSSDADLWTEFHVTEKS